VQRNAVTILGGGLCGALLSIILARRGMSVTVLERGPDPRGQDATGGRSINLAMSARGIRGLKYAGVFEHIEPLLVPMKGRRVHDLDGSTNLQLYGQKAAEVVHSVSRAELNKRLIGAAMTEHGVDVRFDQQAVDYDADSAVLCMNDGSEWDAASTPLIAADGAGSVVRRALTENGVISSREELLEHSYKELEIPAGPGGGFQMDEQALHIWPRGGFMLIALPNPGGDFTLTLFLPTEGENSFAVLDSDEAVARFFDQNFADAVPLIDSLIESWHRNPVGMLGTVRSDRWHDGGRTLLIGDAAHAIVPFHGQGMNLAFEDCVVLDQVIDGLGRDWGAVFETFQREQIGNANAIADMALENYVEMRDTVLEPKHVLRHDLGFALEQRLPGRFIPRYSMVMFHDEIPYAVAQERGVQQQRLLEELTDNAETMADIDLEAAAKRVESRLLPLG
jgi:kynurenine 3-monooxygenase